MRDRAKDHRQLFQAISGFTWLVQKAFVRVCGLCVRKQATMHIVSYVPRVHSLAKPIQEAPTGPRRLSATTLEQGFTSLAQQDCTSKGEHDVGARGSESGPWRYLLGSFRVLLGLPWTIWGPSWAMSGPLWVIFGPFWGHRGFLLGHFAAILGLSWAILEPPWLSWGHLGPS